MAQLLRADGLVGGPYPGHVSTAQGPTDEPGHGVRNARIRARLHDAERTVIVRVKAEETEPGDGVVKGAGRDRDHPARPPRGQWQRCGICGQLAAKYDTGEGCRRRQALDIGTIKAEADAPRVQRTEHGVTATQGAQVPQGPARRPPVRQPANWMGCIAAGIECRQSSELRDRPQEETGDESDAHRHQHIVLQPELVVRSWASAAPALSTATGAPLKGVNVTPRWGDAGRQKPAGAAIPPTAMGMPICEELTCPRSTGSVRHRPDIPLLTCAKGNPGRFGCPAARLPGRHPSVFVERAT